MSERQASLLLTDIIESIKKIYNYTEGYTLEKFLKDDKTLDAVVRNFEIIGEAANRLPEDIKEEYLEVDWSRIKGFRNRIVHDYMGIDYEIVWTIISSDLKELETRIEEILGKL